MTGFSLRDVVRLAGLSRRIVLRLVDSRIVTPAAMDGERNYRFAFADLVVLRTARSLYASGVSSRKVLAALRDLRARLPAAVPLSGLSICVCGADVVVRDRGVQWEARSGQLLLDFDALPDDEVVIVEHASPSTSEAARQFELACAREDEAPDEACELYRRAIACDTACVHAYVNLGCLLHADKRWTEAEDVYRRGLAACSEHALLLFNLAVLQEDQGNVDGSVESYRAALDADPTLADAHFNLARIFAACGQQREALRAYNAYRRLTTDSADP